MNQFLRQRFQISLSDPKKNMLGIMMINKNDDKSDIEELLYSHLPSKITFACAFKRIDIKKKKQNHRYNIRLYKKAYIKCHFSASSLFRNLKNECTCLPCAKKAFHYWQFLTIFLMTWRCSLNYTWFWRILWFYNGT